MKQPYKRAGRYDRENLELAILIVADVEQFPENSLAAKWARLVIARQAVGSRGPLFRESAA